MPQAESIAKALEKPGESRITEISNNILYHLKDSANLRFFFKESIISSMVYARPWRDIPRYIPYPLSPHLGKSGGVGIGAQNASVSPCGGTTVQSPLNLGN